MQEDTKTLNELVTLLVEELQASPDLESLSVTVRRTPDKGEGIVVSSEASRIDQLDWRWRESGWFV